MNLLSTEGLSVGYDNNILIQDINIALQNGEIITLVGPNGAGKTTLLKSVAGLLRSCSGAVMLNGKDLHTLSERDKARLMSVMLTQKKNYEYATCRDVINVGRYPYTNIYGTITAADAQIVDSVMSLVGVSELANREYTKISDGQRQRVLLARALVQQPKVMILDEPTSFLDVGYKMEFMTVLRNMCATQNIGILMSLHELDLAASVSDKIVTITRDNAIDRIGTPSSVLTTEYIKELFDIKNGSYSIGGGFRFEDNQNHDAQKENQNSKTCDENVGRKSCYIMVQGTMSSAGKSLVVAGLCRIFKQDGYRVSPFKSQNMALNSYITEDGLEMGRAQVMQAEAAGVVPDVHMNPILLKPTDEKGSQVIVNGVVYKNMKARDYFEYKKELIPDIMEAVKYLEERNDIIVIEGAGSPAEINLKENDIVNMGMAKLVDAPVILVGDIDRGGVFAQLVGTLELLEADERARVKGLVVNKFRGDKSILDPGIDMLVERSGVPVVGVVPYMNINLEDEDSLSTRFDRKQKGDIDIVVIRLPYISNFTDCDVFEQIDNVSVRYVTDAAELEDADLIIIPGSKNTINDMKWIRQKGMDITLRKMAARDIPIIGICGGYQILGQSISDPYGVEGSGQTAGIGLLPVDTVMEDTKCTRQVSGTLPQIGGILSELSGKSYYGYEIHMGRTGDGDTVICESGNVYGTYIHGIFDHREVVGTIINVLSKHKAVTTNPDTIMDYRDYKEREYDRLADILREHMDMDAIYEMMGLTAQK